MTTNLMLQRFELWLKVKEGTKPETRRIYLTDAADLVAFFNEKQIPLDKATKQTLINYFDSRGFTSRITVERKLTTFSHLSSCLGKEFPLSKTDRLSVYRAFTKLEPDSTIITEANFSQAIERIVSHSSRGSEVQVQYTRARNIVAASLFFRTGAFLHEILDLNEKDFSAQDNNERVTASVSFPKRPDASYEAAGTEAQILGSYLDTLRQLKTSYRTNDTEPALFVDVRGGKISPRRLRSSLVKIAGSPRGVQITPSLLRRSYIYAIRQRGKTNEEIARELGITQISI